MSKMDWFNEARYGMFIHWGAYAVGERGEWVMNRERISREEYTRDFVDHWKAENYDPRAWADLAASAGMKYMVLTARHHDGFALWDSEANHYNAARMGPKRDLVAPYVEAAREAGLKVGLYYSPASWVHPDYPGPFYRDWPGTDDWASEDARQRFIAFYRQELDEILGNYGTIDLLWYDACLPGNIDGKETNTALRTKYPDLLINERNGPPYDFECSEHSITPAKEGMPWEACMTMNSHWGACAGDQRYKSAQNVVDMLLKAARFAGNLLLNVGPGPDGSIPLAAETVLRESGRWVHRNREAITSSDRSRLSWNNQTLVTCRGNMVYHHFLYQPVDGTFRWAEVDNTVRRAWWLATGEEVSVRCDEEGRHVFYDLPEELPDSPVTTMAVELDGPPNPITPQTLFWIPG